MYDLIKKAGFNDINKVKVYGYGGLKDFLWVAI